MITPQDIDEGLFHDEASSDECNSDIIENEYEHVCVFTAETHGLPGWVALHTDTGPIYMTPERATIFAAAIAQCANEAAESPIA